MYRERYGENTSWCDGVKGYIETCTSLFLGTFFKPARLRNDKKLAFIPINLHIQRMKVMQDNEGGTEL